MLKSPKVDEPPKSPNQPPRRCKNQPKSGLARSRSAALRSLGARCGGEEAKVKLRRATHVERGERGNVARRRERHLSKSSVKEHLRLRQAAPQQMLLQVQA